MTRFTELANDARDNFRPPIYHGLRDTATQIAIRMSTRKSHCHVLRHPDFAARNILVEHVLEEDTCHVTGIFDWDCKLCPSGIAFGCPDWLWSHPDEGSVPGSFDKSDGDPNGPVYNDKCQAIENAFFDEIESLLPGFMDVVRESRRFPLKKLWQLARSGVYFNESYRVATSIIEKSIL
ncbi:hypothetical protein M422DRAFT_41164 [Sphaerobolus stellatus SS14]|nr:hypothetical protein M422DRAFT_41164 [Sphaerobolus stellatus SS14]